MRTAARKELGQFITADPRICRGKITKDAIAEAVQLARRALLDAEGRLAQETAAAA